jgi:hypothetical protein
MHSTTPAQLLEHCSHALGPNAADHLPVLRVTCMQHITAQQALDNWGSTLRTEDRMMPCG